jgi:hypothetical protein
MSGKPRTDPSSRAERLASIVDQLACPACFSGLRLNATQMACSQCGRVYPVIDGIPVLIGEQKEPGSSSNSSDSSRAPEGALFELGCEAEREGAAGISMGKPGAT